MVFGLLYVNFIAISMNTKKILESEKMQKDLAFLLDFYEKQGK